MSNSRSSGTELVDTYPAPEAGEKFDRLKTLLREMFQLDRGDLDFGLYRIMNMKAGEIEAFLNRDLLPQVKTVLAGVADEERARIEAELDSTIKQLKALKAPTEDNEKVCGLRAQLAEAKADADAEADVYGHLANFFARYYNEGDFMSLRRYSSGGRATYLIPYDGEEVKLHWANADQYYIKTTENYASYAFTVGKDEAERRVRFEIEAVDNEKDNVKEVEGRQRRFVLGPGKDAVVYDGDDLVVRFEHRPLTEAEKKTWPGNGARQQSRINEISAERVLAALEKLGSDLRILLAAPAPTDANPGRSALAKHIERYTAKNSFDYFIHKDLGGFLRRELDLYLKTEVLNLDDLAFGDTERLRRALAQMRAVRHVAEKIIAFLAQLEDFQKRLWLKKKFVLETQWCVTLDRVPVVLYPEIAANEAQHQEWVALFSIDEITGDLCNGGVGYKEPLNTAFLKANPYLMLDTQHFDADFKDRLLTALSDAGPLDEQTDGLLVHSENFQALNLLQARYGGQVECVYIDPPYNTAASEISYKNDYKHSSWAAMIFDRVLLGSLLMENDGVLSLAIDDYEHNLAKSILILTFPKHDVQTVVVNHYPGSGSGRGNVSSTHEYNLFCVPDGSDTLVGSKRSGGYRSRNFRRSGQGENNFRWGRPNSFFSLLVDPATFAIRGIEHPVYGESYPTSQTKEGWVRVYPIGEDGQERVWSRNYDSTLNLWKGGDLECTPRMTIIQKIDDVGRKILTSVWLDKKFNAVVHGTNLLTDLFGRAGQFSYPKSLYTVKTALDAMIGDRDDAVSLDFFAGSGTTGHAVINLNREDGGERKYILVEMGDHFDTVLLPRLKKVVYAPEWKQGKPVTRHRGMTQLIKYHRLESYEDTLDGLVFTPPGGDLLARSSPALAEDYRLRYSLGAETATSPSLLGSDFTDPFAYTLSVVRDGARQEVPADLPETFNYLLGLRVESYRRINGVLAVFGRNPQGQHCLILWRNLETMDNTTLENWFTNNRGRFPQSFDLVYVNGDHTLNAIRQPDETWIAETIEPLFRELMFEVNDDR